MESRRVLISLLATCALLAQSLAIAGMGPMLHMGAPDSTLAAAEQAMPCHGDSAQDSAAAKDCCDGDTTCAAMCAAGSGLTSIASLPVLPPAAAARATAPVADIIAAHSYTRLRPPIALHS